MLFIMSMANSPVAASKGACVYATRVRKDGAINLDIIQRVGIYQASTSGSMLRWKRMKQTNK